MTETETPTPLVAVGVIARPGVAVCHNHHDIPVIALVIIVGDLMVQLIIPVSL